MVSWNRSQIGFQTGFSFVEFETPTQVEGPKKEIDLKAKVSDVKPTKAQADRTGRSNKAPVGRDYIDYIICKILPL